METVSFFTDMDNPHKRGIIWFYLIMDYELLIDKNMKKMELVENKNIGISSRHLRR